VGQGSADGAISYKIQRVAQAQPESQYSGNYFRHGGAKRNAEMQRAQGCRCTTEEGSNARGRFKDVDCTSSLLILNTRSMRVAEGWSAKE